MNADVNAKMLTRVTKRPPVNIEFNNLIYCVGKKKILKSISGTFHSGHLTSILGSSGAGKTTLLNVLAGQLQKDVSGEIRVNGKPRKTREFHKMSSYIMQEDLVQPFLTVMESITVAANLKLSRELSAEDKATITLEVLSEIGLESCMNTNVENLSGGERKRLIIALELVNNPPVIFLDEPTTGLDDVAVRNCMQLLKSLTLQGRTIICTLHQPSDSLFKLFDMVYFMSDGHCIYNGTVPGLIPFLSNAGFPCPTHYNPADYIIEIVHEQPANMLILKGAMDIRQDGNLEPSNVTFAKEDAFEQYSNLNEFPITFWTQLQLLLGRNFLQLTRNRLGLALIFGHHIFCGLGVGVLFFQFGNNGSEAMHTLKCFYGIVIYIMFTHVMSPILLYPYEVKLLQREYFNRWYSLKAYFAALTITILPIMIASTIIFVTLAYSLTGQPLEWYRFFWFCLICLLMALASQGMGYTIGTLFSPIRGACVGSAAAIPLMLLGMYGAGYGDTLEPAIQHLRDLSFPYHAYVGLSTSVFNDRGVVECQHDIFCYFGDLDFVLFIMGMKGKNYMYEALFLIIFIIVHRILLYIVLRIRVTPEYYFFNNSKLFDLS